MISMAGIMLRRMLVVLVLRLNFFFPAKSAMFT